MHSVGFGKIDAVVCVFDGFESGELLSFFRFGDAAPDNRAGDDLVEALQKDIAILSGVVSVTTLRIPVGPELTLRSSNKL